VLAQKVQTQIQIKSQYRHPMALAVFHTTRDQLAAIVMGMRIFVVKLLLCPPNPWKARFWWRPSFYGQVALMDQRFLFVHWRLPVLKTIHRGDIIVFRYPKDLSELS